jgi:hypothetical protein
LLKRHKPADPTEIFQRAIMIFMDDLEMKDGIKTFVQVKSNTVTFFAHCGEDACKKKKDGGRVDPAFKVYPGCPVMLTENKDVSNRQVNGSQVYLQKVTVGTTLKTHITRSLLQSMRVWIAAAVGTGS